MAAAAILGWALAACAGPRHALASRPELAVTIDDLPFAGPVAPGDSEKAAIARIVRALQRHHAPATAFVICDHLGQGGWPLQRWERPGVELGNHSSSHRSLDHLSIDAWDRDVSACQARLRALTGHPAHWFRYPYLKMGRTIAQRDASLRVLHRLALAPAPVSVDPDDWLLDRAYLGALDARDPQGAKRIGRELIERIVHAIHGPGAKARGVLLLHANALTADYLDRILRVLEREGVHFVSLSEAIGK